MSTLPTLYAKSKREKIISWRVWAQDGVIYTEYGEIGGLLQRASKKAVPTNVGRSNERNAVAQAEFEAAALHKHKLDRKYSLTQEDAQEEDMFFPMLAHSFEGREDRVVYPVDVQPKFDGLRCIAFKDNGIVKLMTRQGKFYNLPHIAAELGPFMDADTVLDGEVYIHGVPLQKINSYAKKLKPETSKLQYYIYDVPQYKGDEAKPWAERNKDLDDMFSKYTGTLLVKVKATRAATAADVFTQQKLYIADGYEGAIVRTLEGIYCNNHRSYDLLKVKTFQDEEFKVVSVKSGVGKMEGCAIFMCETDDKKQFECVMSTTMEERKEYFNTKEKWVGKELTVRFFDYTEDGIPRFPVGKVFRLDEDKPKKKK